MEMDHFEMAEAPQPSSPEEWYVYSDGENRGPYSLSSIRTRIELGVWSDNIPIWRQGETDWCEFSAVETRLNSGGRTSPSLRSERNLAALTNLPAGQSGTPDFPFGKMNLAAAIAVSAALTAIFLPRSWFTHELPYLGDVLVADQTVLRDAISAPHAVGVTTAVVRGRGANPALYLATNVRENKSFELKIVGIPETIVGPTPAPLTAQVTVKSGLGRATPLYLDGMDPFPRGEYDISVACVDCPLHDVGRITHHRLFLGGERDASYQSQLAVYRQEILSQASDELLELRQILDVLEQQLSDSERRFRDIRNYRRGPRGAWKEFHKEWTAMQEQIGHMLDTRLGEKRHPAYYASLYDLLKQSFDLITKIHQTAAQALVESPGDLDSGSLKESDLARTTLLAIRAKLILLERTPLGENGLPSRL